MDEQQMDRRVQRTRQLIREALIDLMMEKQYEKITIQDIIDRANIGRATFYNHYQDKNDLLLRGVAELSNQNENEETLHLPKKDNMTHDTIRTAGMFRHSQENQRLHQVMFKRSQENLIQEQVATILQANVAMQLKRLTQDERPSDVPADVIIQFISGGLLTLIRWWHDQNFPYTPEEMDAYFQQMIMPGIVEITNETSN